MSDAVRRLHARPFGTRLISLGGAAALVLACNQEPIPAARRTAESTGTVAASAPSLAVLESLPPVPAAALTGEQQRGRALYATWCWSCHGPYGHGDGPSARGFPGSLPDLGRVAAREPPTRIIARLGVPPRPRPAMADSTAVWHALPVESLRLVVAYLATMSPTGSRGNATSGRLLYATYCVQCHGVAGRGDGRLATGFARRPANLRMLRLVGREGQVLQTIRTGGARDHHAYMPDWGLVLTNERLWDVVAYLAIYQKSP